MKKIGKAFWLTILVVTHVIELTAQEKTTFDFKRIEDNSFLLEEAYNQEPNVIQHISAFQYMKDKTWSYSFTEEWPVFSQKHQLSTTIPIMNQDYGGLGDILLNYRYQAIFTERWAFSPRLSFVLPTGDYKKNLGSGTMGYQINLPVSFICSRNIVTHYNLGSTITPNMKDITGAKFENTSFNYGASTIILLTETFNLMFEIAGTTDISIYDKMNKTITKSLFINPGLRYAINCKSGLQIVPGIAVPIGIGSSKGEIGLFGYLSFEHPL